MQAGNGSAARALIERMAKLIALKPYHIVMLAHAEIRDGNDEEAASHLRSALNLLSSNQHSNARYLKLHAQAILNMMDSKPYDDLAREATELPCTPRLRRWFPLRAGNEATGP